MPAEQAHFLQEHCVELARILRRYPLRSRKAREFRIWSQAVELWSSAADGRLEKLRSLQAEIRAARAFRASQVDIAAPPAPDNVPLGYLAGVLAGEGHFGISE